MRINLKTVFLDKKLGSLYIRANKSRISKVYGNICWTSSCCHCCLAQCLKSSAHHHSAVLHGCEGIKTNASKCFQLHQTWILVIVKQPPLRKKKKKITIKVLNVSPTVPCRISRVKRSDKSCLHLARRKSSSKLYSFDGVVMHSCHTF